MKETLFFTPNIAPPRVEISIGEKLNWVEEIAPFREKKRVALIADAQMQTLYAEPLKTTLSAELFLLEGGERNKTREAKAALEDALLREKWGRDTLLIALGGGVLLDLAGYLASTYLRGVDFISIPTTLLAMVDASIGGKTGVNTAFGKNTIGTFYHPKKILIDLSFLSSLPAIEWLNGLSEIVKIGLACDRSIWDLCRANCKEWKEPAQLRSLLLSALRKKLQLVEEDPEERKGIRRLLNFGHTIGHALELLSNYQMPHGQAVALGCVAESRLSASLGHLDAASLQEIVHLYEALGFPLQLPKNLPRGPFLAALQHDKKGAGGKVRLPLLMDIGRCHSFEGAYCTAVEESALERSLNWMEMRYG